MKTMRAVVLTGHGGLDKLHYREDVAKPRPGAGEALIRVFACGLNNTDVNTRIGWYAEGVDEGVTESLALHGLAPDDSAADADADTDADTDTEEDGGWGGAIAFPRIQGADACGVVEAVGRSSGGAGAALMGKRVMIDPWLLDAGDPSNLAKARFYGSEVDGGFADYTLAPLGNVCAVDSGYTDAELATFGCAYTTAENLLSRAALGGGEKVVISGASGGVGSAVVQLAKIRGARVIAISSAGKAAALAALGADQVVDRHDPQLPAAIRDAAGGEADVAIDVVGGDAFPVLLDCLRRGGRYASCGAIGGPKVPFDLRKLILRDLQLSGATVTPPGTFARVLKHIETRALQPVLARVFPLRDLAEAQRMFIAKKHVGNIVVAMDAEAETKTKSPAP